jgi:hypothetical protein
MNEQEFRHHIRKLKALHQLLELEKTNQPNAQNNGTRNTTPQPQTPGGYATQLSIDLTLRLFEITRDAANYIQPGRILHKDYTQLCDFLTFNAQPITELGFFDDAIVPEINDHISTMTRFLRLDDPVTNSPWLSWRTLIIKAQAMGVTITREQLRQWARRGKVDTKIGAHGLATYNTQQVLTIVDRLRD